MVYALFCNSVQQPATCGNSDLKSAFPQDDWAPAFVDQVGQRDGITVPTHPRYLVRLPTETEMVSAIGPGHAESVRGIGESYEEVEWHGQSVDVVAKFSEGTLATLAVSQRVPKRGLP